MKATKARKKQQSVPRQPSIFISYCHVDEAACETLRIHFATLEHEGVQVWFDGDILPGGKLRTEISANLKKADIFIALVSADYLKSPFCFKIEYPYARRRAVRGTLHIIPAVIHSCQWQHTRMADYKMLPKDAKPVDQWKPQNKAYDDIASGIRRVVRVVRAQLRQEASAEVIKRPAMKGTARALAAKSKHLSTTRTTRKKTTTTANLGKSTAWKKHSSAKGGKVNPAKR